MMNQTKREISTDEQRSQRIWKYYNAVRIVLIILFIGALAYLGSLK
ncbi:MAG: hypothetical protein MJZ16_10355 [Bacteroidales bacterium]|nr:hypothetical protein [Bacteroidales bacterium]